MATVASRVEPGTGSPSKFTSSWAGLKSVSLSNAPTASGTDDWRSELSPQHTAVPDTFTAQVFVGLADICETGPKLSGAEVSVELLAQPRFE